jgi:hypothetical protein
LMADAEDEQDEPKCPRGEHRFVVRSDDAGLAVAL